MRMGVRHGAVLYTSEKVMWGLHRLLLSPGGAIDSPFVPLAFIPYSSVTN